MIDTLIALIVMLGSLAGIAGLVLGLLVQLPSPESPIVTVTGDTILNPNNCNKMVLFNVSGSSTYDLIMPSCKNGSTMQLQYTYQSIDSSTVLNLYQSNGTTRVTDSNRGSIILANGQTLVCNSNDNEWICLTLI